jgi:hypothetical protein
MSFDGLLDTLFYFPLVFEVPMKIGNRLVVLVGCVLVCSSVGCASIISGREADIAINSNPPQACVAIQNEKGETVATSMTPATVSLKRTNGIFKKAPRYSAIIEKPGYQTAKVDINPKLNPWVFGNIALGGVIGLAADSATGAIWKYTPHEIDQSLSPLSNEYYSGGAEEPIPVANHETVTIASDQVE